MRLNEYDTAEPVASAASRGGFSPLPGSQDYNPYLEPKAAATPAHARGLCETYGLHPAVAITTLAVDSMAFGLEIGSLGALFAVSIACGLVIGGITYAIQKRWYGDSDEDAFLKSTILSFLTIIPTNLPLFIYLPAGALGFVHTVRNFGKKAVN